MRAKWLGWLLLPALMACPGREEPAGPNGKQGVLFFFPEAEGPVAQGLEMEVLLPASLTSVSGRHHLEYDFEGSTLEVEADTGVSVRSVWRQGRSWRFTYRCEPSDTDTGEREVRVRVRAADGAERYADALAVTCRRPSALTLDDVSNWSAPTADIHERRYYVVGSRLRLYPRIGDGLVGRGPWRLEDPRGVLRPVDTAGPLLLGTALELEVARPGEGMVVHLGALSAPVPVVAVEESAVRFALKVRRDAGSTYWSVRAGAVLASDGTTEVGGWGPCELEVRPFLEKTTSLPLSCQTVIQDSAGRGEVCATFRGQRLCETFAR